MAFRSIHELAGEVIAALGNEIESNRGSDERAPALRSATDKGSAAGCEGGGNQPPMQRGSEGSAHVAMGMGKMAGPESPAKLGGQDVSQTKDKSRGGSAVSNRKLMLVALPVSKRMKVARPTGVAPRHAAFIRLVTVNGHVVSHPIA